MKYDSIDSAEMAEMALAQAVDEHIDSSQEVIDRISQLEGLLYQWNQEDIRDLKKLVQEMRILLQKNFQVQIENFINMRKIPSLRVPDEIKKGYHIIAVDKKGIALFGPEMDKLAPMVKITEHFLKKKASAEPEKKKK